MPRINVLDKHTAELIAAGEVVERPASVIKELIENSIDALATTITVEIVRGGILLMRITDNGFGISPEDVPKAFLRHSTSKITSQLDLDAIGTLGFRGEALASVAAVSKTEMITRAEDHNTGTKYVIEGGESVLFEETGCPVGTTITVRDLFYNTPARMKFLKKDVSEGTAVAAVIDRIALSHPEISFRFIREGKEVLLTPGDGKLLSAIYAVYGKAFAHGMIPVSYTFGGVNVSGYVSMPSASRANRNMQHFYINDRYVRSRTMMAALETAYKGAIMVGKFPACVLSLGVAFDQIDVNVHPAKIEVRFSDERPIFDAVYHSVKSALQQKDKTPELHIAKPSAVTPVMEIITGKQVGLSSTPVFSNPKIDIFPDAEPEKQPAEEKTLDSKPDIPLMASDYKYSFYRSDPPEKALSSAEEVKIQAQTTSPVTEIHTEEPLPAASKISVSAANSFLAPDLETAEEISPSDEVYIKYIGESFDAYVMLEAADSIIFIDKHAAHERILYNQLLQNAYDTRQMLLLPESVTLSKEEYNAVLENQEIVQNIGFEIEDFGGGTVLIRSVPSILTGENISVLITEIAGNLSANNRLGTPERLDDILHSIACRAAVKAGNKSSKTELLQLAKEIFASNEVRYCPHGRPVAFVLKRREIEKQFGRIT